MAENENEMVDGYLEVTYKGHKIQVGYIEGFGSWIATGGGVFVEGFTPEEAVELAKREIEKEEMA